MGVQDSTARGDRALRTWARDLVGAIALVEGSVSQHVFAAVDVADVPAENAFGEPVVFERGDDVVALVRRCADLAEEGARVALIAPATHLASARTELAAIAARRLAVVIHAIAVPGAPGAPASMVGLAPALALDDLPWGMLLSAGVADAIDLALVARRAAEDSGCPFFVVHEPRNTRDVEPVGAPLRELCDAFVGPAPGRVRRASFPDDVRDVAAAAGDRALAERVPFALSSAMRELEALTGRHHDVIERAPARDAAVALVGAGAMGDSLLREVDRLRASGHDVAAVRVVAWRPFPAPRLIKALGRAMAVTVLERTDPGLASGAPLAVQLKAAFADAMTWAPDYPGVGRIPRMVSGFVAPDREVDSSDLDAIVHNVLADERGKRTFVLGGGDEQALSAPIVVPSISPAAAGEAGDVFAMRGIAARREVAIAAADLCAAVLASALGVRTRGVVRGLADDEGGGVAFDLIASRQRPRGAHAPHSVGVVAFDDAAVLSRGNALARLAPGGWLAIPSEQRAADALWSEVPSWVKATVFERGARVVGWSPGDDDEPWVTAAAFAGLALAAAAAGKPSAQGGRGSLWDTAATDGAVVAREVAAALLTALEGVVAIEKTGSIAARGGSAARAAFERYVEVPRATIEREDDGVRLGRRDVRVSRPPPRS